MSQSIGAVGDAASDYDGTVGKKGRTESVTKVLAALFRRKTWRQAELAREVDLSVEALRKVLRELQAEGMHLEQVSDPPHVYWSAPRTWFPGGVLFEQKDVPVLIQQLRHLPKTKARDRLLEVIADQLPARARQEPTPPVVTRDATDHDEQFVPIVEEAGARKVPLRMTYLTRGRGSVGERHASVHLVDAGPPARFIATCHRSGELRTFRVDNIVTARPDPREPFRECSADQLNAYRSAGLDGFTGTGSPIACSFSVREPDARWVGNNLLQGMRAETVHGGIQVEIETNAIERLSRFVVSLGAAARPETRELAERVAELARGALDQALAALASQADSLTNQANQANEAKEPNQAEGDAQASRQRGPVRLRSDA